MTKLRWFGVLRREQDDDAEEAVPIGEEHGWWADRDQLSGVPHGRPFVDPDDQARSSSPEGERSRYWTPESIYEESGRCVGDDWDPYVVLGIEPGSSLAEAAAARRRIAKSCHPDVAQPDFVTMRANEERMRQVNEAYEDLRRRAATA